VVTSQATPVDAAACQSLLTFILARGKITFDTSLASIDKGAFSLLDQLAISAKRCPDAKLQIAGYTDARGSDEKNRDLSRRRAEAVVHYLIVVGVDASRLNAVGYGKASPVASNDSEEGRAKNRRIEFRVQ
jgi:OmpA-OmpF porin, OOP family